MYGMCHQRHRYHHEADAEQHDDAPVAVATREPDERLTDADRERAAALLSQAFRDGILLVDEFDQRLSSVYAAATVGDLDAAVGDLPGEWVSDVHGAEAAERRSAAYHRRWRAEVGVYLRVMAVLVGIWFLTNLGDSPGDRYFWPVWPMLGWGIPLFVRRPRGTLATAVRQRRMARAR